MLYRLLERLLRRGFKSRRGVLNLTPLENLARLGPAGWMLAQEKARLEYLQAKEDYRKHHSWRAFEHLLEHLLQLQSTNAVIQSLLNEHQLEQLVAWADENAEVLPLRRSA